MLATDAEARVCSSCGFSCSRLKGFLPWEPTDFECLLSLSFLSGFEKDEVLPVKPSARARFIEEAVVEVVDDDAVKFASSEASASVSFSTFECDCEVARLRRGSCW